MTLERFDMQTGKSEKMRDLRNGPTIRNIVRQMREDQKALDQAIAAIEDRITALEAWVEDVDRHRQ